MLACAVEIVEHAQQLADDGGLGPIRRRLLVAQRPLAVVREVGLHPLQIGGQLGNLAGVLLRRGIGGRGPSRLPSCLGAGRDLPYFSGLGINPPLVGHSYLLLRIAFGHLDSRSSSTTSASTTSSAEPDEPPDSAPPGCPPAA